MHHCCIHPVTFKCLTSECCNWSCRKYSWLETFFFSTYFSESLRSDWSRHFAWRISSSTSSCWRQQLGGKVLHSAMVTETWLLFALLKCIFCKSCMNFYPAQMPKFSQLRAYSQLGKIDCGVLKHSGLVRRMACCKFYLVAYCKTKITLENDWWHGFGFRPCSFVP